MSIQTLNQEEILTVSGGYYWGYAPVSPYGRPVNYCRPNPCAPVRPVPPVDYCRPNPCKPVEPKPQPVRMAYY